MRDTTVLPGSQFPKIQDLTKGAPARSVDHGAIPGKQRPTVWKPGAEKLSVPIPRDAISAASPLPSHAHGVSRLPLLKQTIGDNLRATAERFPDREALVVRSQGYRATYRQLWDATTACARGLLALGVRPGDRVGIWSANRFEWVVVQCATARIGAVLVNINPAYRAGELEYVLRQAGVSVLLYAASFKQAAYGPMLEAARPRCPELSHLACI